MSYTNSAKFHTSCKLKFGQVKLDRATNNHKNLKDKALLSPSSDDPGEMLQEGSHELRRRSLTTSEPICIFCDLPADGDKKPLHLVQSFRLDCRVRRCANILEDNLLQGKLQGGDLIAKDAMYHRVCLSNLYRKASSAQLEGHFNDHERKHCFR